MARRDRHELTLEEMVRIFSLDPNNDLQKLHTRIEIAIGMKVMVTMNISTDADLANGTRGVVTNIILDHREQLGESKIDEGIVTLAYSPAMITFKFYLMVYSREKYCYSLLSITSTTGQKVAINQQQYTLTGGYAFTLQGQTLGAIMFDIRKPLHWSVWVHLWCTSLYQEAEAMKLYDYLETLRTVFSHPICPKISGKKISDWPKNWRGQGWSVSGSEISVK